MKNFLLLLMLSSCFLSCQSAKSDAWENFLKCPDNNCIKEVFAVKDAFLNNPKQLLTQFQATYESGDDRVIGWLYMLRDSVLINPKMGTIEVRLAMQKALIDAAKPYEKDPEVHEMAESVINELRIVDVKMGKINDPMVANLENSPSCYQFTMNGDTTSCQISMNDNGEITGFYAWLPDGKDGTIGVLKGKMNGDTLLADYKYIQEGQTINEQILFVKQGDKIINLVSEDFDNEGRMILTNRKKLKTGDALKKVDCAILEGIIKYIKEEKIAF